MRKIERQQERERERARQTDRQTVIHIVKDKNSKKQTEPALS